MTDKWFKNDEDLVIQYNDYNDSGVIYLFRNRLVVKKEFGAVDNFVLTIVLIVTIGISLSRTLSGNRTNESKMSVDVATIESTGIPGGSFVNKVVKIVVASGSMVSPYVNTLCLFGLTGEVYQNGGSIVFFLIGTLISLWIIYALHYFPIMFKHGFYSFPYYLKKRFMRRGISYIVTLSSLLRHFIGGALNLCVITVGVSAVTGLSPLATAITIAIGAVFCSSVSKIHSGKNSSIGGILIWLVGITCFATLCVTTYKEGGMGTLLSKAQRLNKLALPRLVPFPWIENSIWGFQFLGIILGFQMFAFSRISLRQMNEMDEKEFKWALFVTYIMIVLWTFIGLWGGICVSVAFKDVKVQRPDGLLPKLVSEEMKNFNGFRGFFVAALVAASISGLTRRYNQIVELIWETIHEVFVSEVSKKQTLSEFIKKHSGSLSEEYLKELRWKERKTNCFSNFMFKLIVGSLTASLSCGIVFSFISYKITIWELWLSILCIFIGPIISILFISLLCPCVSHMSVCLGLLIGWVVPSILMLGNKISHVERHSLTQALLKENVPKLRMSEIPSEDSPLNRYNQSAFKETYYVIYNDRREFDKLIKSRVELTNFRDSTTEPPKTTSRRVSRFKKVLSTTHYTFYGPIGSGSCLVAVILFSILTGKYHSHVTTSTSGLLHPCVKKTHVTTTSVESVKMKRIHKSTDYKRFTSHRKKRKKAMNYIQETANF